MDTSTAWAVVSGVLCTVGVLTVIWGHKVTKIIGGTAMRDFINRITSREFIAVGALIGYLFLITVGTYEVPEYAKTVLVPAILMFAGYMAVTGRSNGGETPK